MNRYINALTLWAIALLCPIVVQSQAFNPAYLSEMPAPARVVAEIKGKIAEDAQERQMGAFKALRKIVDDLAYGLEKRELIYHPERSTPDEVRIKDAYWQAYSVLWNQVKNTYGKQYAGDYDLDRDLLIEMLGKFFSESFRAQYFKSNKNAGEAYQAFHDRMYKAPANNNGSNGGVAGSGGPGTTAAMRRCVESGRTIRRCYVENMGTGFGVLFGINPNEPMPVPPGPRMSGDYASAGGFRLLFEQNAVTVVCRGARGPRPYTVEVRDSGALVSIVNQGSPVVFSLRQDGKLSGPGSISVTGLVAKGSHTEQTMGTTTKTTTKTTELTPLEAQNYPDAKQNGQVYNVQENASELVYGPTGTRTVTDYETKTAGCNAGVLSLIGASPLPNEMVGQGDINPLGVLTSLGSGLAVMMQGGSVDKASTEMLKPQTDKPLPPGLRMNGTYAGASGFSLNFHPESVSLGCGEAERAVEYVVRRTGNKTMIFAKDNEQPISFQLMPDGSILGEGAVQVNGRMVTGQTDDPNNPFVFAPRVARCETGRLVADGSPENSSVEMNTMSGRPTSAPVSNPARTSMGSSAPTSSDPPIANAAGTRKPTTAVNTGQSVATSGGASLTISAGPGVAKLLAGKALVVLKDNLENVLAQGGVSAQGRSSRVSAWTHACDVSKQDPICQQGAKAFSPYFVSRTGFDATGTATFPNVPSTGTFYLVADTSSSHHLMWNVRVDLKPGANTIKLDESNMTPIDR